MINSDLLTEGVLIGNLAVVLSEVGGRIGSRSRVSLPKENLSFLLSSALNSTIYEHSMTSQGLEITHSTRTLDLDSYPGIFGDLHNGDRKWTQGTSIIYRFMFGDCSNNSFCKAMTNLMEDKDDIIILSGNNFQFILT